MPSVRKKKTEAVKSAYVLTLHPDNSGFEVAIGEGYYDMYPLPADQYANFMGVLRLLYAKLVASKEEKHSASVEAAKALAENMGDLDGDEAVRAIKSLIGQLADSSRIHPLEFLSHAEFADEVKDLISTLTDGVDEVDREKLTMPQQIRLVEVCLLQNFLPLFRLAGDADRIFRQG